MGIYPWQFELWQHLRTGDGRQHHALLLQGRQGLGKLAFGKTLAQAILCESPGDGGLPCGRCPSCTWFDQDNHPDFRSLEPEGKDAPRDEGQREKKGREQISVSQVRELADFVNLSTHRNGFHVILIHPAESMNTHAANALLKTLEEPPPHTLIILVSHQPSGLLPTLRSRCRKVDMPPPVKTVAIEWLRERGADDADLCLAQSGGAPLAALEMGQQAYQEQRRSFIGKLVKFDAVTPFDSAEKLHAYDLQVLVNWLQQWIYDLISVRLTGNVRYHVDFAAVLEGLAETANMTRLFAFQRSLVEARRAVHHPLNTQLLLESLLISYAGLIRPDEESIHD